MISRDEREIPYFTGGKYKIRCKGIHKSLKQIFYPWRDWSVVAKRSGSSRTNGIRIHRQLRHYYVCKKGRCICGLKRFKQSSYLKPILDFLAENDITITDSEVPIFHPKGKIITWVDAIGHYNYNPNFLIKISLKTGYSDYFKSDHRGLCFEKIQSSSVKCSTENMHHLQSLCEDIIMNDVYKCKPDLSFTLYVSKNREKNTITCKRSDYPDWCKKIVTRKEIARALEEGQKKKTVDKPVEIKAI